MGVKISTKDIYGCTDKYKGQLSLMPLGAWISTKIPLGAWISTKDTSGFVDQYKDTSGFMDQYKGYL